ncbi:MAG: hypothetical protein ACXW3Z_02950, partial [Limisphaerales bacterium]
MQMEMYRRMTGEERLAIGLRLDELSSNIARESIRQQNPGARADELEEKLHEIRRLTYRHLSVNVRPK